MRIDVITLFPGMFAPLVDYGVVGRALDSQRLEIQLWSPRDYADNPHRHIDDRPYGGGPGMVMRAAPLRAAIQAARESAVLPSRVVYLSPQGRRFDQDYAQDMVSKYEHLILVSGRYEGIDERLIETEIDEELSIGDYVLTGGELAAMVVIDSMARLIPGVLGHEDSADQDSFTHGLLDYGHYTRPREADGLVVPEVLLSGDHEAIKRWREKQALGRTWLKRPDMLEKVELNTQQREMLDEFIVEYRQKPDQVN